MTDQRDERPESRDPDATLLDHLSKAMQESRARRTEARAEQPDVAVHDRTGDVLIWTRDYPTIRSGGKWVAGPEAMQLLPDADALKDDWTIVEGDAAKALIAEAIAALPAYRYPPPDPAKPVPRRVGGEVTPGKPGEYPKSSE